MTFERTVAKGAPCGYRRVMRPTERMTLMDAVGAALDSRYSMTDIDTYFATLGISTANVEWEVTDSNRTYAKAVLKRISEGQLLIIADDLEIPVNGFTPKLQDPPLGSGPIKPLAVTTIG